MIKTILVVCTGNICRSPAAAALLADRLGGRNIQVHSAGLSPLTGRPVDPPVLDLMGQKGYNLSAHRARPLDAGLVREADLILVMEAWQQKAIEGLSLSARGKVHLLGKWGGFEIEDPYGRDATVLAEAMARVERGVADWVTRVTAL